MTRPCASNSPRRKKKRLAARAKEKQVIDAVYERDVDEAIRLSAELLNRDLKVFGEDHDETAKTAHYFSITLWGARKYKQCIELQRAEAAIYAKNHGKENWRVLRVLANVFVLEKVAAANDRVRPSYGRAWSEHTQAQALMKRQEYAKSLATAERCAATFKAVLSAVGIDPEQTMEAATALKDMTEANLGLGRYARAEGQARQALHICGRVFGRAHPAYADYLDLVARVHSRKGEYAQAELALREALDIYTKSHDTPHRDTAYAYVTLARVYSDQDKLALAGETYKKGLQVYKEADEPYPITYSTGLGGLATVLRRTGKLDEAEELENERVAFVEKKFGADGSEYANALNDLGHLQIVRKKYKSALQSYTKAAKVLAGQLGTKHPNYAIIGVGVGLSQGYLKQYTKAEKTLRNALAILRKKLGDGHRESLGAAPRSCAACSTG